LHERDSSKILKIEKETKSPPFIKEKDNSIFTNKQQKYDNYQIVLDKDRNINLNNENSSIPINTKIDDKLDKINSIVNKFKNPLKLKITECKINSKFLLMKQEKDQSNRIKSNSLSNEIRSETKSIKSILSNYKLSIDDKDKQKEEKDKIN